MSPAHVAAALAAGEVTVELTADGFRIRDDLLVDLVPTALADLALDGPDAPIRYRPAS